MSGKLGPLTGLHSCHLNSYHFSKPNKILELPTYLNPYIQLRPPVVRYFSNRLYCRLNSYGKIFKPHPLFRYVCHLKSAWQNFLPAIAWSFFVSLSPEGSYFQKPSAKLHWKKGKYREQKIFYTFSGKSLIKLMPFWKYSTFTSPLRCRLHQKYNKNIASINFLGR